MTNVTMQEKTSAPASVEATKDIVVANIVKTASAKEPELRVTCSTFRIAAVVQKAGAIQNSADARQEYCS